MQAIGRIIIDNVTPEIDGGRFPARRIIGETMTVTADIFAEGQHEVRAFLLHRKEKSKTWRKTPMRLISGDRWEASFMVDQAARYQYTIQAWISDFLTWRKGYEKKFDFNVNSKIDVDTGVGLLGELVRGRPAAVVEEYTGRVRRARTLRDRSMILLERALAEEAAVIPDDDSLTSYRNVLSVVVERERAGFSAWYEFFPRSAGPAGRHGTLRDAEKKLTDIATLGFDVVYLPPVHPIGMTNRKGKNNEVSAAPDDPGSPWAIGGRAGGHKQVHPEMGT
ncbi:MAG TPA: DUF3416 domain-containing protein, partial [Spirochaetia bacterium]|nr:DUF3416 domain-containing protein [Spirochaetia bacterium]